MPTNHSMSAAAATDELRGSLEQTMADLKQAVRRLPDSSAPPPSMATLLTRLSRELAEAAEMVRAVPGHADEPSGPGPRPIAVPMLRSTSVRGFLSAVADALIIPTPAVADDEATYLRVRSRRADEALRAVHELLAHPGRTELDYAWVGANLRRSIKDLPADGYAHNPMAQ